MCRSQHYLLAYRDALAAICRAQMNRKKRLQVLFSSLQSTLPACTPFFLLNEHSTEQMSFSALVACSVFQSKKIWKSTFSKNLRKGQGDGCSWAIKQFSKNCWVSV